ncbi:sulfatase [Echinicola strongylocentroti]|uniref:Sulfatase n=1 Tax=Echinicola strongylocentroti TaxID=1795355 RepID=A0A2Z4IQG4_9BACT|nr:sulfatase [Echinicola strongylocentroti]AWW32878.1 sulfatase [Echinicola strongylocentroti]
MKYLLFTSLLLWYMTCSAGAKEKQPNIIILFVDDYGWSHVGYRNATYHTPNLAQLKREGMEFTRAYVPTPTCSPSRASLLTGKEAIRMEMPRHIPHEHPDGSNSSKYSYWETDPSHTPSINWLPLEEVTYAESLANGGYTNYFIGKWHLGHEPYHPIHQGFDDQFGTSNFGHPRSYYPPYFNNSDVLKDTPSDKYLTDNLTDRAVEFLENYDKTKPFQLSFWYYNVHGPHEGPKELVGKYLDRGMPKAEANYAAMVEAMDTSVGRIKEAVEKNGLAENTIIFLISDQGGLFSNAPLSGGKRGGNTLGEGGARVPFIVWYPEMIEAGSVFTDPIQTIDVYPTLMDIAGLKGNDNKDINGISLLPALKGESLPKRNLYFYRAYEDQYAAIIRGPWKLKKYRSGKVELYNIDEDISETHDLVESEKKMTRALANSLAEWEKEAVPFK